MSFNFSTSNLGKRDVLGKRNANDNLIPPEKRQRIRGTNLSHLLNKIESLNLFSFIWDLKKLHNNGVKPEEIQTLESLAEKISNTKSKGSSTEKKNLENLVNQFITRQFGEPIVEAIRELIVNAIDAQIRAGTQDKPIYIRLDENTLTIEDHGDGITPGKLMYLLLPGFSSNGQGLLEPGQGIKGNHGKFGQGALSMFELLRPSNEMTWTVDGDEVINAKAVVHSEQLPHHLVGTVGPDDDSAEVHLEKFADAKKQKIRIDSNGNDSNSERDPIKIKFDLKQNEFVVNIEKGNRQEQGTKVLIRSIRLNESVVLKALRYFRFLEGTRIIYNDRLFNNPNKHIIIEFNGGKVFCSNELRSGLSGSTVTICENGKKIVEFKTKGINLFKDLVLDFNQLKQSQDRASVDLNDEQFQEGLRDALGKIWGTNLAIEHKISILNGLVALPTTDHFSISEMVKPFIVSIADRSLPNTAEFRELIKGDNGNYYFVAEQYLNEIKGFQRVDWDLCTILKLKEANKPCTKIKYKGEIYYFLDESLLNLEDSDYTYNQVNLVRQWLNFMHSENEKLSTVHFNPKLFLNKLFPQNLSFRRAAAIPVQNKSVQISTNDQFDTKINQIKRILSKSKENQKLLILAIDWILKHESEDYDNDSGSDSEILLLNLNYMTVKYFQKTYPNILKLFKDTFNTQTTITKYSGLLSYFRWITYHYFIENLDETQSTLQNNIETITKNLTQFHRMFEELLKQVETPQDAWILIFIFPSILKLDNQNIKTWKDLLDETRNQTLLKFPFITSLCKKFPQIYTFDSNIVEIEHIGQNESIQKFSCETPSIYFTPHLLEYIITLSIEQLQFLNEFLERFPVNQSSKIINSFLYPIDGYFLQEQMPFIDFLTKMSTFDDNFNKNLFNSLQNRLRHYLFLQFLIDSESVEEFHIPIECLNDVKEIFFDNDKLPEDRSIYLAKLYFDFYFIWRTFPSNRKKRERPPLLREFALELCKQEKKQPDLLPDAGCTKEIIEESKEILKELIQNPKDSELINNEYYFNLLAEQDLLDHENTRIFIEMLVEDGCVSEINDSSIPNELRASLLPLEEDPDLLKELGNKETIRQRLAIGIGQNLDPFNFPIRELIRNSIQAGASNISIQIFNDSEGNFYLNIEDDGSGMNVEAFKALKVPGKSTKNSHEYSSSSFGIGFFSVFSAFDEVYVTTSYHKTAAILRKAHFTKSRNGKIDYASGQQRNKKNSYEAGTSIFLKMNVDNPHIHRAKFSYLTSVRRIARNIPLKIELNGTIISNKPSKSLAVSYMACPGHQGNSMITIEATRGFSGVYRDNFWIMNLADQHLQFLTPALLKLLEEEKISFKIALPEIEQVSNRSSFVNQSEIDETIAYGVLWSSLKALHHILIEKKNGFYRTNYWKNFYYLDEPSSEIYQELQELIKNNYSKTVSPEQLQKSRQSDILIKELSEFIDLNRRALTLPQPLKGDVPENSLRKYFTLVSNKNQILSKFKSLLSNTILIEEFLLSLNLDDSISIKDLRDKIKAKMISENILAPGGWYNYEDPAFINCTLEHLQELVKGITDHYRTKIGEKLRNKIALEIFEGMNKIEIDTKSVIFSENEREDLINFTRDLWIHIFDDTFIQIGIKSFNTNTPIIFKEDFRKIYINCNSKIIQKFILFINNFKDVRFTASAESSETLSQYISLLITTYYRDGNDKQMAECLNKFMKFYAENPLYLQSLRMKLSEIEGEEELIQMMQAALQQQ